MIAPQVAKKKLNLFELLGSEGELHMKITFTIFVTTSLVLD